MKTLVATVQFEFPEYTPIAIGAMALPLYYARLEVEVLEPQELTIFQTYILNAVALGVNSAAKLSWLLGVAEEDMAVPAAALLHAGYLTQTEPLPGQGRGLALTALGHEAYTAQGPLPVPKRRVGQLHFNAVTWHPIPKEDRTFSIDDLRKHGLPVLPAQESRRPTLGDFTEHDVTAALNGVTYFHERTIIAILNLRKIEPEYVAPIEVVLLEHRHTNERRLAVYSDEVQQAAESRILQRLFDNGRFTMPPEASLLHETQTFLPAAVDPDIANITRTLLTNEIQLADLTATLEVQREIHSQSQDERERRELAARIASLEEQLQSTQANNAQLRAHLAAHDVTFLRTEEHRAFLERALREAQTEIIIISPWVRSDACDPALCRLIAETAGRGVAVRIGYGVRQERPQEAERNRDQVRQVQRDIQRYLAPETQITWHKTDGTHQKILVCDRQYATVGSFNWLSYRGAQDKGYRRETSSVFAETSVVTRVADIALEALRS